MIVYFHILSYIMPYSNDAGIYKNYAADCKNAANIVTLFFLLAGLFLYRTFMSNPRTSVFEYTTDRIIRLWPVMALSMVSRAVINGTIDWKQFVLDLFFLRCTGLSLKVNGILWYISSFFFASVFLYSLLRLTEKKKAIFFIALLSYFSFVFRINYSGGNIGAFDGGRETHYYILNMGVLRGVGDMGLGILLAHVHDRIHSIQKDCLPPFVMPVAVILRAIGEVVCICLLFRYFLLGWNPGNHILIVLIMCFLILSMISSGSVTGKLFNRKWAGTVGKYSYAIYAFQEPVFLVLKKTLWNVPELMNHPKLALGVSILIVVVIGVIVYYLIERPVTGLYLKWKKQYREKLNDKRKTETVS